LRSFFSMCQGAMPIVFYEIMGDLINILAPGQSGLPGNLMFGVSKYAALMGIVAAAAGIMAFFAQFFTNVSYERLGSRIKYVYFSKLLTQEIGFFDRKKTGKLLSHLGEDVLVIQESLVNKLAASGQFFAQFVLGVIMAFVSSWQMALIMVACSPPMVAGMFFSTTLSKWLGTKSSHANAEAMNTATEVISSIRTVKSMGGEPKEMVRFGRNQAYVQKIGLIKGVIMGIAALLTNFSIWGAVALAFWYGGNLVSQGIIPVGNMIKVYGMMLIGSLGASQFLAAVPELGKALKSSQLLLVAIRRVPQIRFSGGLWPNKPLEGNIEFDNVSLVYPTRPDVVVLKKFTLRIKSGQQVALVGASGSGKSTTLSLLERFYEAKEGIIKIDGYDIRDLDPVYLHAQMAIVSQEPVLFACSLRENILYGVDPGSVSEEDVINATKTANAYNFIMALDKKLDTQIGERGLSLSGGQKQRIAIARAVLQNPKILLLDEATSALDSESEHIVQDALYKLMKGRTTIVVAHRLSTIRDADVIVVMENGQIREMGKHQDLLDIGGVYHKLASRQMMFANQDEESVKSAVDPEDVKLVAAQGQTAEAQPKQQQ